MKNLFKKFLKSPISKYLGILIILIIILFLYQFLSEGGFNKNSLLKLDSENLQKISIQNIEEDFYIEKVRNDWEIKTPDNSYKADSNLINDLLKALKDAEITNIVSNQKDAFSKFDVGEDSILITLGFPEDQAFSFYLGKQTSYSANEGYIRVKDSDETVSIKPNLSKKIFSQIIEWKDRTIVFLNKDDVSEISLESEDIKLKLSKEGENWAHDSKLNTDKQVAKAKVDNILNTLNNFRAHKLTDEDFGETKKVLSIKEGENEYLLSFGETREDKFIPVKISTNTVDTFLIYEFSLNNLFPTQEDLLEKIEEEEEVATTNPEPVKEEQ